LSNYNEILDNFAKILKKSKNSIHKLPLRNALKRVGMCENNLSTRFYQKFRKEIVMNAKKIMLEMLIVLLLSSGALADRALNESEILSIFQKLTQQPKDTWLSACTIEATREQYKAPEIMDEQEIQKQISREIEEYMANPEKLERSPELQKQMLDAIPFNVRYKLSNEYTMKSFVVLKYDGERYYWDIDIESRSDSVTVPEELEGNPMTEEFNLQWNKRRIYAWDGGKYTFYTRPVNNAIVDAAGSMSHNVNGPLTAGIIPWGYGYFTYDNLAKTVYSANEQIVNKQTEIQLTLNISENLEIVVTLDPEKDYAVLSCVTTHYDTIEIRQFSGYQLVSKIWIPTTISIEKRDATSNNLLSSDYWNFTSISSDIPSSENFDVEYENDALISYKFDSTKKSLLYRHSIMTNTDLLLAESLAYAELDGIQPQNCATSALQFAAFRLGKDILDPQLGQLVNEPNQTTSLYAMKKYAENLGFYCKAIKTDIQSLKNFTDCQVILHIPGKNHFVLIDHIDSKYVWIVNLSDSKFFYRTDINFFGMDWTEGTALLVSKQPVLLQQDTAEISDALQQNIIGGYEGYQCTYEIQSFGVVFCKYDVGLNLCYDYYKLYLPCRGCWYAETGSCSYDYLIRKLQSLCINSPIHQYACTVDYEWEADCMLACYCYTD
jgi:hypothetical protein